MFTTRVLTASEKGLSRLAGIISRVGRIASGTVGSAVCICPECGHIKRHDRGTPCSALRCPRCSTPMKGENC